MQLKKNSVNDVHMSVSTSNVLCTSVFANCHCM